VTRTRAAVQIPEETRGQNRIWRIFAGASEQVTCLLGDDPCAVEGQGFTMARELKLTPNSVLRVETKQD
jgi:hypothetical protein